MKQIYEAPEVVILRDTITRLTQDKQMLEQELIRLKAKIAKIESLQYKPPGEAKTQELAHYRHGYNACLTEVTTRLRDIDDE